MALSFKSIAYIAFLGALAGCSTNDATSSRTPGDLLAEKAQSPEIANKKDNFENPDHTIKDKIRSIIPDQTESTSPTEKSFASKPNTHQSPLQQPTNTEDHASEKAGGKELLALKIEQERQATERAEAQRLEAERIEAEQLAAAKAEAERIAAEKAEAQRLLALKAEQERLAAERAEAQRLEAERIEAEQLAAAKAEAERIAAEKAEAQRLLALKAEQERQAAERAEAQRLAGIGGQGIGVGAEQLQVHRDTVGGDDALGRQFRAVLVEHSRRQARVHHPYELGDRPVEAGVTGQQVAGVGVDHALHGREPDAIFV